MMKYLICRTALALAFLGAAIVCALARDVEPPACLDLERAFSPKAELSSLQINAQLFRAADRNCGRLARMLLDAGGSVEARDRLGAMPLAHAARAGHLPLVRLLLERGAPIDARDLAGSTALYAAAENDRLAVLRELLEKGADPNLPGRSGPLAAAAFRDNDQAVALLLARGADPKVADKTGKTPIMYAAALGFAPIVRRLLDAGVAVDGRDGNELTALMWAAGHADNAGSADAQAVVTMLLDRGAAIDAADNRGRTPLMIAAERGHAAIVALLLARGAAVDLRDKGGKTARDLAANDEVREKLAGKP
jgi:uncharacterized protein